MLVLQRNVAELEDQIGDEDDLAVLYLLSFSIYYFHVKFILFITHLSIHIYIFIIVLNQLYIFINYFNFVTV